MSRPGEAAMTQQKPQKTVTFTMTDRGQPKTFEFPVLQGVMGPEAVDMRAFYQKTGLFLTTLALPPQPAVTLPLRLLMGTKAYCCTEDTASKIWPKSVTSLKWPICFCAAIFRTYRKWRSLTIISPFTPCFTNN